MDLGWALLTINAGAKRQGITLERKRELYKLKQLGIEHGLRTGEVVPGKPDRGMLVYICGEHRFHVIPEGAEVQPPKKKSKPLQANSKLVYYAVRYMHQQFRENRSAMSCRFTWRVTRRDDDQRLHDAKIALVEAILVSHNVSPGRDGNGNFWANGKRTDCENALEELRQYDCLGVELGTLEC